jgi:hypothetical protein
MSTNIKLLPFNRRLTDLFPEMSAIEFNELVADIEKHGQRNEIDTWNGEIIEGKHRALACQKLGKEPRYRARRFESEIGARQYVVSQNFARRHLSPEHKRALIAAFADWSKSDRAIAKVVKADKNTVAKVRKEKEGRGEIHHVDKRTDTKGRKQPAVKKGKPKPAPKPARETASKPEPGPLPGPWDDPLELGQSHRSFLDSARGARRALQRARPNR